MLLIETKLLFHQTGIRGVKSEYFAKDSTLKRSTKDGPLTLKNPPKAFLMVIPTALQSLEPESWSLQAQ
jgi:hypothetical protein